MRELAKVEQSERLEPVRGEREPVSGGGDWDATEAVRAAAHRELHTDLLERGVKRLAGIAGFTALVLGGYAAAAIAFTQHDGSFGEQSAIPTFAAGVVVSLGTLAVTRLKKLRPQFARDVGYAYLLVLSLLLGLLRHTEPWSASQVLRQVSPVVFPILAFSALVPASARSSLILSLAAASMDPLAMYLLRSRVALPEPGEIALALASPFLAALVAQRISGVVYSLTEGIVKAREVGSYRLVERLGIGGMAEVWRADHHMLVRPAAVKLIRPQVLTEHGPQEAERLLRLFLREARTTAQLNSPHTIQLYDFGVTREGAFYYVMELLDGLDLKDLVERFGPQPPERVCHLLCQVCHSLHEAHTRQFVHRDIKPGNIFATRYGADYDFVKVLDFGLVLDRHPTPEELDDERQFVGTPSVMAPEMVRFQAPVDERADIYAVGCVAYWLLTGRRLFEAESRQDMLVMHAHQKPIAPSKRLGRALHLGLEAVVMNCLEKNPDRRPQTAHELRDALTRLSFDQPWSEERRELWWKRYLPIAKGDEQRPVAEGTDGSEAPPARQDSESDPERLAEHGKTPSALPPLNTPAKAG